jgi:hypothetical protein
MTGAKACFTWEAKNMKGDLSTIVVGALMLLAVPALHAQSDIYAHTYLMLDLDGWNSHGYGAVIATYEVQFYYDILADTILLQDGKEVDLSSANSCDDEYLIAGVSSILEGGKRIQARSRLGLSPYYHDHNLQGYDAFNYGNLPESSETYRINYARYIGRGPAKYLPVHSHEMHEWDLRIEAEGTRGSLRIEVQSGKAWTGGGSVVLDDSPTTMTELAAKGMTEAGKFRWTVGPKLKLIGSAKKSEVRVRGTGLSKTKADSSVLLSFISRTGKKQTASIAFTVREPTSLMRFGVIVPRTHKGSHCQGNGSRPALKENLRGGGTKTL